MSKFQAGLVTLSLWTLSTSCIKQPSSKTKVDAWSPELYSSTKSVVALFQIHLSSLKIVPTSVTTKTVSWSEMSIQPENTRTFPTPQAQVQAPLADP